MDSDTLRQMLREATPGPWTLEAGVHGTAWGGYWQINAQYDAVACNQFCMAGADKPSMAEANARLIAAAPDLAAEVLRLQAALIEEEKARARETYAAAQMIVQLQDGIARLCDWIEAEYGRDLPFDARAMLTKDAAP